MVDELGSWQRERVEVALRVVERQLRAGDWVPTLQERRIAGDLGAVVGPALSLPPHTDAPLWWRLQRGAAHAAALRLAAAAGGWELPTAADAGARVDLGVLLAGLAEPAGYLERCWQRYEALSHGWRRDGDDALLAEIPGLPADLAAAETLLDGAGLASTLAVIATGLSDDG